MPKKKYQTIFNNQNEYEQFILACIADCSAIGAEMSKYGKHVTQKIVDDLLKAAYSRFSLILGEHARRFANGEVKDFLADLTDEDFKKYRKDANSFTQRVMGEKDEGKEQELPAETNADDAKTDK